VSGGRICVYRTDIGAWVPIVFKPGDSGLNIPTKYNFINNTSRDAYFTSNSSELYDGMYCISNSKLYHFIGSQWEELTSALIGPKGDKGDTGNQGISPVLRFNSSNNQIQVSYDNGSTWSKLLEFTGFNFNIS
jgi:hypothetical protein